MTDEDAGFAAKATGYAHPEVLVSTAWVAAHLTDPGVRVVEADEDVLLYEVGHIPGAVKLDWHADLQDPVARDFVDGEAFARLLGERGIGPDTTVVLYGDRNNWYATYALWLLRLRGHRDARVMDGGRAKWEAEGRPLSRETPAVTPVPYTPGPPDPAVRAFREDAARASREGRPLIDVRSPAEYKGELIHMLDYPQEGAQRGGHIPGATSIPWALAAAPDGTFRPAEELRALYQETHGLRPDQPVISYCRIGERSSHTWFVLSYLLGFPDVRNYDGSWTEWGNLVAAPIERP